MHPFTMEALLIARRMDMELAAERARLAAPRTRSWSLGQIRAAAVNRWRDATARQTEVSTAPRAGEVCCA